MKKKKLLFVFGTRPEALKMAPLILRAKKDRRFQTVVCLTAQHREMADQVLKLFKIKPDYDLNIMQQGQTLGDLTHRLFAAIEPVFKKEKPDLVLVQGDTTTAFGIALKAFYDRIPCAHIEAGLRSHDKYQPFPEEINRVLISHLADFHFPPTKESAENLYREGVDRTKIFVTGNTVVDALLEVRKSITPDFLPVPAQLLKNRRMILITAHRRENLGKPLHEICRGIRNVVRRFKDAVAVYPVHMNPRVREVVQKELGRENSVYLIPPVSYEQFLALMEYSYLILTDSGGIQEEAPSFRKPVLVMREVTERPDGVRIGVARLVGTSEKKITAESVKLFTNKKAYASMTRKQNPYGDGKACVRILNILAKELKK